MCSNCGFPFAPGHWTEAGADTAPDRLRARFRRVALLQSILPAFGLSAYDDGATRGITLATPTGNQEMVTDLTEFWIMADKMIGKPVDPLSPQFTGAKQN